MLRQSEDEHDHECGQLADESHVWCNQKGLRDSMRRDAWVTQQLQPADSIRVLLPWRPRVLRSCDMEHVMK